MTDSTSPAPARTEKMRADRQADSAHRRQRIITARSGRHPTSLQADHLLAAHERGACLNALVRQLQKRLSELLDEETWQQMRTIDKRKLMYQR